MMTAILERGQKRPIVFEQWCSNVSIRVVRFQFFFVLFSCILCMFIARRVQMPSPLLPSTISNNRLRLLYSRIDTNIDYIYIYIIISFSRIEKNFFFYFFHSLSQTNVHISPPIWFSYKHTYFNHTILYFVLLLIGSVVVVW